MLINTAAVADNIRDIEKQLSIPDLISEGSVAYGMQSFDQSLMQWYKDGVVSYESALFYSSNPSEFALRVSGVEGSVRPHLQRHHRRRQGGRRRRLTR